MLPGVQEVGSAHSKAVIYIYDQTLPPNPITETSSKLLVAGKSVSIVSTYTIAKIVAMRPQGSDQACCLELVSIAT